MNVLYKVHDFSDGSLLGFLRTFEPVTPGMHITLDGNRYKVEQMAVVAATETVGGNPVLMESQPVRVLDVVDIPDQIQQGA